MLKKDRLQPRSRAKVKRMLNPIVLCSRKQKNHIHFKKTTWSSMILVIWRGRERNCILSYVIYPLEWLASF
jgi:hypothetical protein